MDEGVCVDADGCLEGPCGRRHLHRRRHRPRGLNVVIARMGIRDGIICSVDYDDDCIDVDCGVGGTCNDEGLLNTCSCANGYTGGGMQTACEVDYDDDCATNPCGEGGTCTDEGVLSFSCVCADGYKGGGNQNACAIDLEDDCENNPCGEEYLYR